LSFDTTSPWGTFAPHGLAAVSLRLTSALPRGGLFRRLAFLARKPVKSGRQTLYDRDIWGLRLRLSARGNLSEQRWLTMPQFHDWPERQALRDALSDGAVFVDVGANAGFYTFWALAQRQPALTVIAVEPNPAMLERVRFNLDLNGLGPQVRLVQCAVTPEPCEVALTFHADNLGQTAVRAGGGEEARTPGRPLLDIVRDAGASRIDALKIDIEGHEIPVLTAFFATAPRSLWPRLILGEIVGADGGALRQLLLDRGYVLAGSTKMNGIFRLP
jgi:FkbM family methyltransferase